MKLDLENYEIKNKVQSLPSKFDLEAIAGKCRRCHGLVKYREAIETYFGQDVKVWHAACFKFPKE